MKNENLPSKNKLMIITFVLFIGLMFNYFYEYYHVYNSIEIKTSKTAVVEYGSPNYDIREVVDSVDGEIVSIKKDIDTTKVGPQEIIVEVEKNQVVKEVKKYFNDKVYKNVIPRNVKLSEAPSYGMPISVYDPRSKGAKSYEKFVREFIKNNEGEAEGKGKHAL